MYFAPPTVQTLSLVFGIKQIEGQVVVNEPTEKT
jgi:hypothetical protein